MSSKHSVTAAVATVALLGTLAIAQGPPPGGHGHGPGPFWRSERARASLGITAEQQAKLESDFKEARLAMVDLRAAIEKKRMAFDDRLEAESFDEGAAKSAATDLEAALAQLHQAETGHAIALRRILTAEQYQKVRTMRPPMPPRRHGGRGGPGPDGAGGADSPSAPDATPAPGDWK